MMGIESASCKCQKDAEQAYGPWPGCCVEKGHVGVKRGGRGGMVSSVQFFLHLT